MADKHTTYKREFNENNYDRIYLTVPKGKKEEIKEFAESKGKSLNSFINDAVKKEMEN